MTNYKDLTFDNIKSMVEDFYEKNKDKIPYAKKIPCGLWEVFTGSDMVYMSDTAYEQYNNKLKEIAKDSNTY